MKLKYVQTTLICQMCKPENRKMLEGYAARRDKSNVELANYYSDFIAAIAGTPAFGVSGVNKIVNELTSSLRAVLARAKRGKTTAYAHANKILSMIDHFENKEAELRYNGNHKLRPLLTEAELDAVRNMQSK